MKKITLTVASGGSEVSRDFIFGDKNDFDIEYWGENVIELVESLKAIHKTF